MKNHIALAIALALGSTFAIAGDKHKSDSTSATSSEATKEGADKAGAAADAGATSAGGGKMMQWDKVDANKDGYVSKEEAKDGKIAADFASIDTNADGRLSKDEFAALQAGSGAAGPAGPASDKKMQKQ